MNEFNVSISKISSKREFNNKEMEMFDILIADNTELIKNDNVRSFVEQVGSKGHVFCPSTFKEGLKSKDTFEQSQLLALHFDSKETSFKEIKDRTEQYDLPILFAYDAFSIGSRNKFSIVFLKDSPSSSLKEAEAMQNSLMMMFPEADKSCDDVSKVYNGGNKVLYFDDTTPAVSVDMLFMNMSLHLRNRYGATNYKRKIVEFSKTTGVALNERKLPEISIVENFTEGIKENINDKNSQNPIMIDYGNSEKLSKLKYLIKFEDDEGKYSVSSNQKKPSSHKAYPSDTLKSISSSCRLYQEFELGNKTLSQQELLGIATNLTQVESGETKFKDMISSNSYYCGEKEKYDNWSYYFYYIKDKGPRPCISFCSYHATCPHGKDILSTSKPKYHQIEKIANCNNHWVGLDEAWKDFKENFHSAVMSRDKIWHVIKCQTALGKTQAILELLRDTHLRVLIAVPTNKLKREECERAKAMGVDIIVSPSLHELKDDLPQNVWDDIENLYETGRSPMPRLNKAIAEDDLECAKLFKQYKRELDEFNNMDGHAITTHRRLTSMDVSKFDLVIIDEDLIFSTVIPSKTTVPISKLKKLKKKLNTGDPLAAKIVKILKHIKKSEFFTLSEIDYDRSYSGIKMTVNIPALCDAKYFCYRKPSNFENDLTEDCVSFINPIKFQEKTKYIMLSATADKDICEYCFGEDNVKFYTSKEAKLTGTLFQYGGKPMSRSFMRDNPGIIGQIKKWSGLEHTISFKKLPNHYKGDLHFGNCSGCDILKNENIDVIGTPHQPEWIYKLFSYSLGFGIDTKLKPNTIVTHNGYRFRFNTYDDKTLRDIQFYMIESELEQAVGRARLLRCECTVNLFSNFPLRQATIMNNFNYDDNES